jgi:hypothetical protein
MKDCTTESAKTHALLFRLFRLKNLPNVFYRHAQSHIRFVKKAFLHLLLLHERKDRPLPLLLNTIFQQKLTRKIRVAKSTFTFEKGFIAYTFS